MNPHARHNVHDENFCVILLSLGWLQSHSILCPSFDEFSLGITNLFSDFLLASSNEVCPSFDEFPLCITNLFSDFLPTSSNEEGFLKMYSPARESLWMRKEGYLTPKSTKDAHYSFEFSINSGSACTFKAIRSGLSCQIACLHQDNRGTV